jgi:hypothetical protein
MQKRITHCATFFMICISFVSSGGCEKSIELSSRWRKSAIVVDGIGNEWDGATIYAAKEKVSLTMINDSTDMYICINTRDRHVQAQVLRMGLTLWFDPDGGENKICGIRFPLGTHEIGMPMMPGNYELNQSERLEKMFAQLTDEMEILGPGEEDIQRISFLEAEMHGINVRLGYSNGNLVYELKVPFAYDEDHLFAIGLNETDIDANTIIGIGFETPEITMEEMKEKMEERGMGMPPAGGAMPPRGMPNGGMRGSGPQVPERLSLWTKVRLASDSSGQE